ncbi:hypothetical protein, partial [Archangium sp.]|uniref:hypothetical protein n=1 Tax=Archangium sp. TaxID=1872627 RepID=UPI002D70E78B
GGARWHAGDHLADDPVHLSHLRRGRSSPLFFVLRALAIVVDAMRGTFQAWEVRSLPAAQRA